MQATAAKASFAHEYLVKEHLEFGEYRAYRALLQDDPDAPEATSDFEDIMVRPKAVSKNSDFEKSVPYGGLTTTVDLYVPNENPPEDYVLVPESLTVLAPHPFTYGEALEKVVEVLKAAGVPLTQPLVDDPTGEHFFKAKFRTNELGN